VVASGEIASRADRVPTLPARHTAGRARAGQSARTRCACAGHVGRGRRSRQPSAGETRGFRRQCISAGKGLATCTGQMRVGRWWDFGPAAAPGGRFRRSGPFTDTDSDRAPHECSRRGWRYSGPATHDAFVGPRDGANAACLLAGALAVEGVIAFACDERVGARSALISAPGHGSARCCARRHRRHLVCCTTCRSLAARCAKLVLIAERRRDREGRPRRCADARLASLAQGYPCISSVDIVLRPMSARRIPISICRRECGGPIQGGHHDGNKSRFARSSRRQIRDRQRQWSPRTFGGIAGVFAVIKTKPAGS